MPSFDIVSEINLQEVDNAVNQASKEIGGRFDFKGTKYELEFDKDKCELKLVADSETRLDSLQDIINTRMFKRGIELGVLDIGKLEQIGGMNVKRVIKLKQGIETEAAKKIIKLIKDTKLKVEAAIQDKQIRVTGKNIDDLQEIIAILKGKQGEIKLPLQFINMRK